MRRAVGRQFRLFYSVPIEPREESQQTPARDRCGEILAAKMGITLKQFLRRFTWDTYLSAREAVEVELAGRVLEPHVSLSLVAPPALKAC